MLILEKGMDFNKRLDRWDLQDYNPPKIDFGTPIEAEFYFCTKDRLCLQTSFKS